MPSTFKDDAGALIPWIAHFNLSLQLLRPFLVYALIVTLTRHIVLGENDWRFYKVIAKPYYWKRLAVFLCSCLLFIILTLPLIVMRKIEAPLITFMLGIPMQLIQFYVMGRLAFVPYHATCGLNGGIKTAFRLSKGTVSRTFMIKCVHFFLLILTISLCKMFLSLFTQQQSPWSVYDLTVSFGYMVSFYYVPLFFFVARTVSLAHYYQSTCVIKSNFKSASKKTNPPIPQLISDALPASTS